MRSYDLEAELYVGPLELEVPIIVTFCVDSPDHSVGFGGGLSDVNVERQDGLQWHDGIQREFEAWWKHIGFDKAWEKVAEHGSPW